MCRLLAVKSDKPFPVAKYVAAFAEVAKTSPEYQGHGWGCTYRVGDQWQTYKNIRPIWDDNPHQFGETTLLLAHARSAFRDEGIVVENNMPFSHGNLQFIFNGELRGVRIKADGRIGAEKIFNFVRRFEKNGLTQAVSKGTQIIENRSKYIRALNFMISDGQSIWLNSLFNQDEQYFTMHEKRDGGTTMICSAPFGTQQDWQAIPNRTQRIY